MLMVSNCLAYYEPDSLYYRIGERFMKKGPEAIGGEEKRMQLRQKQEMRKKRRTEPEVYFFR